MAGDYALHAYAHCGWMAAYVFCEALKRLHGGRRPPGKTLPGPWRKRPSICPLPGGSILRGVRLGAQEMTLSELDQIRPHRMGADRRAAGIDVLLQKAKVNDTTSPGHTMPRYLIKKYPSGKPSSKIRSIPRDILFVYIFHQRREFGQISFTPTPSPGTGRGLHILQYPRLIRRHIRRILQHQVCLRRQLPTSYRKALKSSVPL